jgi:hypothetical protein
MIRRVVLFVGIVTIAVAGVASAQEVPRYEVGGQISPLQDSEFLVPAGQRSEVGFGGRFTWNVSRFIAADSQIDYYNGDVFSGGRIQGLVGVKAGIRKNRIGVFGKVRPGVLRTNLPLVCAICLSGGSQLFGDPFFDRETMWSFAVDTGAVVEAYPMRRLAIRFDIGDVYLKLKRNVIVGLDRGEYKLDPFYLKTHTLQMGIGAGFRF